MDREFILERKKEALITSNHSKREFYPRSGVKVNIEEKPGKSDEPT